MTAYALDICLNFRVAYYEDAMLVVDFPSIAKHYAQTRLVPDLLTTIPFDWIVLGAMGLQQSNSQLAWYISMLRLLRLGRVYRVYDWVVYLTYHQSISLLCMTLVRNFLVSK